MTCILKKYLDPVKILKFSILFVCGLFTLTQVSECVNKLVHPPVSTHYFYLLNDTIRYPSVTICRHPAYKTWVYPKYGVPYYTDIDSNFAFQDFKFENYTLEEFMADVTYGFSEVFRNYAYAGVGYNKDLKFTKSYHLSRGSCHTITPLESSDVFTQAGGYLFYLNFNTTDIDEQSENGYEIFLHDPNELLTYADNQKDSFLKRVMLEYAENMEVLLDVSEYRKLSSTTSPCISDENYSKSKCIEMCVHMQVATKANCTAPWLILPEGHSFPLCDNYISIRELIKDFRNSRSAYMENCHCYMACNITIYYPTIIKRKEEFLNAPHSTIQMYFGSNLVSVMHEKASYDWIAFVADVGGSLGFLLGLSVLSFMCLIEQICLIVFQEVIQKLKKKGVVDEQLHKSSSNDGLGMEDEGGKNNTKKVEETEEPKVVRDYKHIKDSHYRVFENNIFEEQNRKNS